MKAYTKLILSAAVLAGVVPALGAKFPENVFVKEDGFRAAEMPAYCHDWYTTEAAANWVEPRPAGIEKIDFSRYDWIVINSSAGKDSQEALRVAYTQAKYAGFPLDQIVVVHCDLGRVEWGGTAELAEAQASLYPGVRFVKLRKPGRDLLEAIEARGMWPDSANRFCTSDYKRAEVDKLFTLLTAETMGGMSIQKFGRRVRILNVLGFRASESPARAKRLIVDFGDTTREAKRCVKNADGTWKTELNKKGKMVKVKETYLAEGRATNGRRIVDDWLPLHDRTDDDIWEGIRRSGVAFHKAYKIGMRRLSCTFCVFAPKEALLLAGRYNYGLLTEYVRVSEGIKERSLLATGKAHTFRQDLDILDIKTMLDGGYEPDPTKIRTWKM